MSVTSKTDKLYANAVDVIPREELDRRLESGRTLTVKLGFDPTAPDIHLGHAVVLRKLRQFQDMGHTAVLIIGDYTARVGDPSGRAKTRPILSPEQIEENTRTYLEQAYLILDRERTEVRRNSEWLAPIRMADVIELTRAVTVARILERDDFSKRYAVGDSITLTELLYPLLQAYDSVAIDADVEIGGTDQLYNLLMGRHIMEYYDKRPQCVLTTPLLVGTDGTAKMSKSLGNYIGVADDPRETFGKAMSIPDELMPDYYSHVLGQDPPEAPPVEQKRELARSLVRMFHSAEAAAGAEEHFNTVASRGIPEDVLEIPVPLEPDKGLKEGPGLKPLGDDIWIVDLITHAGFANTNGEARRFIRGGAVRLNGEVIKDEALRLRTDELHGRVLQVGKRRYARFVAPR
jgi:tyrosyl-tRNA synthetase